MSLLLLLELQLLLFDAITVEAVLGSTTRRTYRGGLNPGGCTIHGFLCLGWGVGGTIPQHIRQQTPEREERGYITIGGLGP